MTLATLITLFQEDAGAEGTGVQEAAPAAPVEPGPIAEIFGATPWVDIVGLGFVALFFILGIKHGLVWQVTRLIGVLAAIAIARTLSPKFIPKVQEALELPERACQGIVWFLVFAAVLMVASALGMVGKRALEAIQLGPMDRMGGALAGAMTGVVVHAAALVLMTSLGSTDWAAHTLRGSRSAMLLDNLSRKTHVLLDAQAAERIVEPWGATYDIERAEAKVIEANQTIESSGVR